MINDDFHPSYNSNAPSKADPNFSFELNTGAFGRESINRQCQSSYMIDAVYKTFMILSEAIKHSDCKAYSVTDKSTGFKYERLGLPFFFRFETKELAGKKFYAAVHFFNYNDNEKVPSGDEKKDSTSFHNHLVPIGVIPFHAEGRFGEVAYQMPVKRYSSNGNILSETTEYPRYGMAYALEDPVLDYHQVISSQAHLSLVVGHLNGKKNDRESNTIRIENESRTNDLKIMAEKAHRVTFKELLDKIKI